MILRFSKKHIGLINFKRIYCENGKVRFYLIILILQFEGQRYSFILIFFSKPSWFLRLPREKPTNSDRMPWLQIRFSDYLCATHWHGNILDKQGRNPLAWQTTTTILHMITSENNLVDIWRDQQRDIRTFPWTGINRHNNTYIHTQIDKFHSL